MNLPAPKDAKLMHVGVDYSEGAKAYTGKSCFICGGSEWHPMSWSASYGERAYREESRYKLSFICLSPKCGAKYTLEFNQLGNPT